MLLLVVAAHLRRLPGQQGPTQPVLGIVRDSAGQQPLPTRAENPLYAKVYGDVENESEGTAI